MARTIRTILFTASQTDAPELRKVLTTHPDFRIIAELDEPSMLPQAVTQFAADLIVADLDPMPDVVIECLRQIRESCPELVIFALSGNTEGNVVLGAMRAGIKEYFVKPLNIEELEQAVTRNLDQRPRTKEPGKLISVMGTAGGVGATSIATNLAIELTGMVGPDQTVVLIDLDFRFGQVATLLDVHGQYTVADLCSTPEQLDREMILKALIKHDSGLYVLRRPHSFAQAELITAAHCANVITGLQEMCAYVIVDGPTRHDPCGRIILDAADYNLFVLQLLVTSVRNTDRMVQELAVQGFNTDRISFVCNRVGRESAHLEVNQVETILNRKMYVTIADDWKAVSSSINIGQPLKVEYERSRVRQDIRALAMRIHRPEEVVNEDSRRTGRLSKWLRRSTSERGTVADKVPESSTVPIAVSQS